VCAVYEALCLVSDGHYTELDSCFVSDKEKGRHALWGRITYHKKRERHINLYIMGLKSSEHERPLARWY
jgi:hypothetical protein